MKKTLGALLVLGTCGVAMAQSSVTMFGVIDAGFTYGKTSGGESNYGMSNSGNSTSRLGFRGVEDLGGGLKAGFWLEGGMQNDEGSGKGGGAEGPGFEFKRRSSISLMGNFGEMRLGRGLTRAYDDLSRYDVFGQVGIGQNVSWDGAQFETDKESDKTVKTSGNVGGAFVRVSNMVTYISPTISGFKGSFDYGFGEKIGEASANRYFGGSLTYDNGPLSLALVAEQLNADRPVVAKQIKNTRSYGLGGSYDFNSFKLGGLFREHRIKAQGGGSYKVDTFHLGGTVPVGGGEARLGYNYYNTKQVEGKAHQLSLGYVHNLSKRTAVYGTYSYMTNKKDENFQLSSSGLSLEMPAVGKSQNAISVGLRHRF